jgi:hypothetical protein
MLERLTLRRRTFSAHLNLRFVHFFFRQRDDLIVETALPENRRLTSVFMQNLATKLAC